MVALGRVAAAVGHDFGHLLTIVLSHAQEILADARPPGVGGDARDGRRRRHLFAAASSRVSSRSSAGRQGHADATLALDEIVAAPPTCSRDAARRPRIELALGRRRCAGPPRSRRSSIRC